MWYCFSVLGVSAIRSPETQAELANCVKMARPLVKNPEDIFPLTKIDLERVCTTWAEFRQCASMFIEEHLSEEERRVFQMAVGSSFQSIEQLCRDYPEYTREYLENAPCLRKMSMETRLCGQQFNYLVDLAQGLQATDVQMCCAHQKFRECMLEKTNQECNQNGRGSGDQRHSEFTRTMLDNTLGFFLKTCKDFVPNSRDCPVFTSPGISRTTLAPDTNHNSNNNHNGNNNNLRPDATTSSFTLPPSDSTPSTRFTWTTPPTTPSLALAGNSLTGPESQQYKGQAPTCIPTLFLYVVITLLFRLL
ncbi:hypothetical protein Pmani_022026 [Petrolisthes manimaculis]|uniref:Uncharacterized protein n=1 Tax=Petrolisthes manimaculis TaxID=1843537 RepID=A0AAE1PCK5_9EUCA|nr:hypothetical protein Pmani_022026 [Petrolisthes manimaculis]